MRDRNLGKIFWLVTAVGAITRLGVVLFLAADAHPAAELPDEVQYWQTAQSLADGEGLRDELGYRSTRMPLYPAFLSLFVGMNNGRLLALATQALASALACGFVAYLAFQLAPDRAKTLAALLAGLLVAFDPFLVYFCRFVLTESFFITAMCAMLAVSWPTSDRRQRAGLPRWLMSGVLCTLCVYLRPSSAGFIACWCLLVLLRRRFDKTSCLGVLGIGLILAGLLSPWAARNKSVTGEWVWLTTRMGISLYDGVHPTATGASDLGQLKYTGQDELDWSRDFKKKAWAQMRSDPTRMIRLAGRKFVRTWNLWPNAEGYQSVWIKLVSAAWTLFILAGAAFGVRACRGQYGTIVGLLLPALYFTALHMVFVGSVRYRLPAMPMIEVLSAIGLAAILGRNTMKLPGVPGRSGDTQESRQL